MDRLNQLKREPGGSRDSTLDSSLASSDAFLTANDSSKYFSLSDSTFDISPSKDVGLAPVNSDSSAAFSDPEQLISNLSPIGKKSDLDGFKIGKHIEAANILSGGVDIFEDNENSLDGDELVIDEVGIEGDDKVAVGSKKEGLEEDNDDQAVLMESEAAIPSKETEVVLQIDGKNVDAIDIGNGLYLYRREGDQENLAAVQITDTDQLQPSIKFLKVRENAEGNLEVYEEFEVEVPKEVPSGEDKQPEISAPPNPVKDASSVVSETGNVKIVEKKSESEDAPPELQKAEIEEKIDPKKQLEHKSEVNFNGKTMKFNESRKSPIISTYTPMTYHSTPNKEGIPLTKTMVDMHLHPSRHSESAKKTIEVNTDSCKQKMFETPTKMDSPSKSDHLESNKEPNKISYLKEKAKTPSENQGSGLISVPDENLEANVNHSEIFKQNNKPDKISSMEVSSTTVEEVKPTDKDLSDSKQHILLVASSSTEHRPEKESRENRQDNYKAQIPSDLKINLEKSTDKESQDSKTLESKQSVDNVNEVQCLKQPNTEVNIPTVTTETSINSTDDLLTADILVPSVDTSNKAENKTEPTKNIEKIDGKIHIKELALSKMNKVTRLEKEVNLIPPKNSDVTNTKATDNSTVFVPKPLTSTEFVPKPLTSAKSVPKPLTKDVKTSKSSDTPITNVQPQQICAISTQKTSSKSNLNVTNKSTEKVDVVTTAKVPDDNTKKSEDVKVDNSVAEKTKPNIDLASKAPEQVKDDDKKCEKELNHACKTQFAVEKPKPLTNFDPIESKNTVNLLKSESKNNHLVVSKPIPTKPEPIVKAELKSSPKDDNSEQKKSGNQDFINNYVQKAKLFKSTHVNTEHPITTIGINTISKSGDKPKVPTEIAAHITIKKCSIIPPVLKISNVPKTYSEKESNSKTINNNAVPFGKWTEANKQAYLVKIKESKVTSSNTNQIKQTNDLNRRDVLKKFDSQRQSNAVMIKSQEQSTLGKQDVKTEGITFKNKVSTKPELSKQVKGEKTDPKNKPEFKVVLKPNPTGPVHSQEKSVPASAISVAKIEQVIHSTHREINTQSLIDRTIEDILMDRKPQSSTQKDDTQTSFNLENVEDRAETPADKSILPKDNMTSPNYDIERQMNELHGMPFIERPVHELPKHKKEIKTYSKNVNQQRSLNKTTNIPHLLPLTHKTQSLMKSSEIEDLSEEEIIEHVPITGDIEIRNTKVSTALAAQQPVKTQCMNVSSASPSNKDGGVITEKDFDKFARRNSITYENSITVEFDSKQHNVVKTVVKKDHDRTNTNNRTVDTKNLGRFMPIKDDSSKNYQSKLQLAYQTALTAKRHKDSPITIIEDKPVKVIFADSNAEFVSNQLNVQGQDLSPAKRSTEIVTPTSCDSLDYDVLDALDDSKYNDNSSRKTKHQRKQVLTPVETPELELIEPNDIGIHSHASPKKKRRPDETVKNNVDFKAKGILPKKTYLLARSNIGIEEPPTVIPQENTSRAENTTAAVIDSLVKAAELLENQSEKSKLIPIENNSPQTPVKRGRGRPRKNPALIVENVTEKNKVPSPQKKPRLEKKTSKIETSSEEDSTTYEDDDEITRENWTMGKINENIVCPICSKLFRSENVVFKHVKHCTGPSPNRSDSDKRSPRRGRSLQDFDDRSDSDDSTDMTDDSKIKNPKSQETPKQTDDKKSSAEKSATNDSKNSKAKKSVSQEKTQPMSNNLVCEFCGKTFRQLSYLVSHKMQHKKEEIKKPETDSNTSVFSCEVCKKEFRKLHHLVQHRIIHKPNQPVKRRKTSSIEQLETKTTDLNNSTDDPSTGFRCEPCDKSFRKLHHLVEHRETHDGINRQKSSNTVPTEVVKPVENEKPPQCDVCKKTFRKLHHLIEHKEQHVDAPEKKNDKNVRNSLSAKDIIHECPLCYMVFPNGPSLDRHSIKCQKKEKTAAKSTNLETEKNESEENIVLLADVSMSDTKTIVEEQVTKKIEVDKTQEQQPKNLSKPISLKADPKTQETKPVELNTINKDKNTEVKVKEDKEVSIQKEIEDKVIPKDIKKPIEIETIVIEDTPKKKVSIKDKPTHTATKRRKTSDHSVSIDENNKIISDDDEIRYMFNPDYKIDECKMFMNVRANKRNSLQIDPLYNSPNSKDLIKRRASLQNPQKIVRTKSKNQLNAVPIKEESSKDLIQPVKLESQQVTDSDDSEVKYSFPKHVAEKPKNVSNQDKRITLAERKMIKKSLSEKRKSLNGLAKRKSVGKAATPRTQNKLPAKTGVKKRSAEVGHRCDCGQLFNSAALLSRHTTLAHTPPRIRRRRSPTPETNKNKKSTDKPTSKEKPVPPRKSILKNEATTSKNPRKSSVKSETEKLVRKNSDDVKLSVLSAGKTPKKTVVKNKPSATKTDSVTKTTSDNKVRKSAAHKGVPMPEKMRKLKEKLKK